MKALVDIGNSRTKFVFESNGSLSEVFVVNNDILSSKWYAQRWLAVTHIYLACVSNKKLATEISNWSKKSNIQCDVIVSEGERFGVKSAYKHEQSLGVDRWLALIGGLKLYPNRNIVIIDAGTATTIDVVDASGVHQGGWILPGIELMKESLLAGTSNVVARPQESTSIAFGKNTTDCVNNAAWAATTGGVNVAITQARTLLKSVEQVILTGGNGALLQPFLPSSSVVHNDLIFHGIQRYSSL
ncbi:type III pantothenate kinase [Colwelliaceae bacterium 6471]